MVPNDIYYATVPAVNSSAPCMETCCAQIPVHRVNVRYIERDPETGRIRRNTFSWCLIRRQRPFDESRAYGWGITMARMIAMRVVVRVMTGVVPARRWDLRVMGWGLVELGLVGVWAFRSWIFIPSS